MQHGFMLPNGAKGHGATHLSKKAISRLFPSQVGPHFCAEVGVIGRGIIVFALYQLDEMGFHIGKGHGEFLACTDVMSCMGINRKQQLFGWTQEALSLKSAIGMAVAHLAMRIDIFFGT